MGGSFIIGLVVGLFICIFLPRPKVGCLALLAVPLAMIVYIGLWQALHPENIRSTSALDFVFGPLWPSLGAIAGYLIGKVLGLLFCRLV